MVVLCYQIQPDGFRSSYVKAEVEIYEHIEGGLSILYKGRRLRYTEIMLADISEKEEDLRIIF